MVVKVVVGVGKGEDGVVAVVVDVVVMMAIVVVGFVLVIYWCCLLPRVMFSSDRKYVTCVYLYSCVCVFLCV